MSIDSKETNPSEKLRLIGPDNNIKQVIYYCIKSLNPKLFEQNIGIVIKINPEYLIEAAQMLKDDPDLRLIILGCAGDKPDKRLLGALINNERVCKTNLSDLERILELSWQLQKDIESGKKPEQDPDNEKELDDALLESIKEAMIVKIKGILFDDPRPE
jgi:hypothetical protein